MAAPEVLASGWAESVRRLRLGIRPVDALGGREPVRLRLHIESVPVPAPVAEAVMPSSDQGAGLPQIQPNRAGRFALAFGSPLIDAPDSRIAIRLVDPTRRFVPRRLSIPVPTLQDVLDAEDQHEADPANPIAPRACQPAVFPGAAYGEPAGATVVRGRVEWAGGRLVRWARIHARTTEAVDIVNENGDVVGSEHPDLGFAHGDEFGEFVLIVTQLPRELATQRSQTVGVTVEVAARPEPAPNVVPASPTRSRTDPLWHMPVEEVQALAPMDAVAAGKVLPGGFTSVVQQDLSCRRGRVTRPSAPFVIP